MADLNALIAQGVQFKAPPDPFAQYAQMQQLQQGQQANQLNQMKMQEYQRGVQEQNALRGVITQPGFDPMNPTHQAQLYNAAPSLAPKYIESALTTKESTGKITAADIKAKADKQSMLGQAYRDISQNPSDAQITAHLEDVLASSVFSPTEKASIQRTASDLLAMPVEQRKLKMASQGATASDLKPQVVGAGAGLVPVGATEPVYTQPVAPSALEKEYDRAKLEGFAGTLFDFKKQLAQAGATKVNVPVNVSTEKKYGEQFGSKIAEADSVMRDAALKAPEAAANANRILELVQNPNVFTGTGATLKLNIAKALNMTGATDIESAANTEALLSATGQSTLNAIKTSGLGTGQGFTDKDLKFLQGIAGGTISMEKETIARLADLQHRVATATADKWTTRKKSIPASALEGTGIGSETITVPPRVAGPTSTAPKVGIVQNGYRFKGGNPADKANWEKL